MKLTIYISSERHYDVKKLLRLFNLQCQVHKTWSSNPTHNPNKFKIEDGYCIRFFEIDHEQTRKVWGILQLELKVNCVFVVSEQYRGCILNWPKVFRSSICAKL